MVEDVALEWVRGPRLCGRARATVGAPDHVTEKPTVQHLKEYA